MTNQDTLTGKVIKSYELHERIGLGGFGAVYRAHQDIVNRDVAVKIILPGYANHPDFIRSFEAEAQLVASLEHPFIVPLYDYWREPDGAYLVMRWLRGGSLGQVLKAQTWSLPQIATMVEQICGALSVAHRQNVVHRDIKPDNILLDDDGNAYLTDFGIATGVTNPNQEDGSIIGSIEYMAPEQILKEDLTARADIYSLGIVLYQVLTGHIPFYGDSVTKILQQHVNAPVPHLNTIRPELPDGLNKVIWRATTKSPKARYQDALHLAEDFRRVVSNNQNLQTAQSVADTSGSATNVFSMAVETTGTVTFEGTVKLQNPYKGLRAFEENDARDFFGREAFVQRLVDRLSKSQINDAPRFLAVVGPSGSGKSSVVKAGLLPALRNNALPNSQFWFLFKMEPADDPIGALRETLLRIALNAENITTERLKSSHDSLHNIVEEILPTESGQFVLFIDQFEEVFTLLDDETERLQFLNLLHHATTIIEGRLWVILTLRADFYDRPLQYADFGALIRENTEVILPLAPNELEIAILNPAERVGLEVETGLAGTITAEVSNQPGALPLLQYAMTELFDRRDDKTLTLKAFNEIGGVSGALAKRAEMAYTALDSEQQNLARHIFLRLVSIGEDGDVTRHRTLLSELLVINADSPRVNAVINAFSAHRLLTLDRDPKTRTPTVQLAHEALIARWERLREWIDDNRDDLRLQKRLAVATDEWQNAERDSSFLASGSRLEQFETLQNTSEFSLNDAQNAFLRASINARQGATNRVRMFIASLVIISIIAVGFALFAIDRQNQAEQERDRADQQSQISRSRELAILSLTGVDDLDLSLALSLEALNASDTFEARNSLLSALQSTPHLQTLLHRHSDHIRAVTYSDDGRWLASAGRDNTVIIWDAVTFEPIHTLDGHTGWVNALSFDATSTQLASSGANGRVIVWDVVTGEQVVTLNEGVTIWSLAFHPSSDVIAVGREDGTINIWDAESSEIVTNLEGHSNAVYSLVFTSDGATLASGGADNSVRLWDMRTSEAIGELLEGHSNWVMSLAFNPDNRLLASGGADNSIVLWDTVMGQEITRLPDTHTDWIRSLAFSPDGFMLTSGSADGTIRFWDTRSLQELRAPLMLDDRPIWDIAYSEDGQQVVSVGERNSIAVWDLNRELPLITSTLQAGEPILRLAYSADGALIASANGDPFGQSLDSSVNLWNVDTGAFVHRLDGHVGPVLDLAFHPDGDVIASIGADQQVILWDTATGEQVGDALFGHDDVIRSVGFSPDGALMVTAGEDGHMVLWDTASYRAVHSIQLGEGVTRVAFSPDGTMLASADRDDLIRLWDVASWEQIGEAMSGHSNVITDLAFSPDGRVLASGSRDETVMLWDVATQTMLTQPLIGHEHHVLGVDFSSNGDYLVSSSRDGTVMLWDVATHQPLGQPLRVYGDWVNDVAFSPDSGRLVSGGNGLRVIVWDVALADWQAMACEMAGRNLTLDEWNSYFGEVAYHATCE